MTLSIADAIAARNARIDAGRPVIETTTFITPDATVIEGHDTALSIPSYLDSTISTLEQFIGAECVDSLINAVNSALRTASENGAYVADHLAALEKYGA